jgi:hypothetical protein
VETGRYIVIKILKVTGADDQEQTLVAVVDEESQEILREILVENQGSRQELQAKIEFLISWVEEAELGQTVTLPIL